MSFLWNIIKKVFGSGDKQTTSNMALINSPRNGNRPKKKPTAVFYTTRRSKRNSRKDTEERWKPANSQSKSAGNTAVATGATQIHVKEGAPVMIVSQKRFKTESPKPNVSSPTHIPRVKIMSSSTPSETTHERNRSKINKNIIKLSEKASIAPIDYCVATIKELSSTNITNVIDHSAKTHQQVGIINAHTSPHSPIKRTSLNRQNIIYSATGKQLPLEKDSSSATSPKTETVTETQAVVDKCKKATQIHTAKDDYQTWRDTNGNHWDNLPPKRSKPLFLDGQTDLDQPPNNTSRVNLDQQLQKKEPKIDENLQKVLNTVAKIKCEAEQQKQLLEKYSGCGDDVEYRSIKEKLIKCMIKLDDIEEEDDIINNSVRETLQFCHNSLKELETNLTQQNVKYRRNN